MLEREQIEKKLPHRQRALLVDRFIPDRERGVGIGYLTVTEEICEGHFPGNPIMRAVDRVEFITLTLGLFVLAISDLPEGKLPYLAAFGKSRFPEKASLGDEVRAEVIITRKTPTRIQGSGKAYVGERLVAEVKDILCVIGDAPRQEI